MVKSKIIIWLLILSFVLNPLFNILDFNGIKADADPSMPIARDTSSSVSSSISGQVNPFSGSFGTSIPIEAPPNRNGFQPSIGLGYTSSNTIGVAGVGWDLPLSYIIRLGPRKSAPTYTSADEFYLNLNGSMTQMFYDTTKGYYRTRIESWSKIIARFYINNSTTDTNRPMSFIVKSKSGDTYMFGTETKYASCIGTDLYYNCWMLEQVADANGNIIDYTYQGGAQNGYFDEFLISAISYGKGPTYAGNHLVKIEFKYEPSNSEDYRESYFLALGLPVKHTKRLKTAKVWNLVNSSIIRQYDLTYVNSNMTNRSLLSRVQVTAYEDNGSTSTAIVKPPLEFTYSSSLTTPTQSWWTLNSSAGIPGIPFVDDQYSSNRDYPYNMGSVLLDINGDGLDDKIDRYTTVDENNHTVEQGGIYLQIPQSGGTPKWTANILSDPGSPGERIPGKPMGYIIFKDQKVNIDYGVRFGDVNGDGIPDKIDYYYQEGASSDVDNNVLKIYLANDPSKTDYVGWVPSGCPTCFANLGVKGLPFSYIYNPGDGKYQSIPRGSILADVNGDGYVDKIDFEKGNISEIGNTANVRLGTGTSFSDPSVGQCQCWTTSLPSGDLDNPGNDVAFCRISTYSQNGRTYYTSQDLGLRLVDINGDGLPDFVKYSIKDGENQHMKVWLNTGRGWGSKIDYDSCDFGKVFSALVTETQGSVTRVTSHERGANLMDINGDGLVDKVDRFLTCSDGEGDECTSSSFNGVHINRGYGASECGRNVFFSVNNTFYPWSNTSEDNPLPDGTNFSQKFYIDDPTNPNNWNEATRDLGLRVTDINGDGYPDFIKYYKKVINNGCFIKNKIWLSNFTASSNLDGADSKKADLLIMVKSELGGTTRVKYKSGSSDYNVVGTVFNGQPGRKNAWVVDSITFSTADNNSGDEITTIYNYFNPNYEAYEKQPTGFRYVKVTNPDGTWTYTTYKKSFPFTGMVEKVEYYDSAGVKYKETGTDYLDVIDPYNANIHHPQKTKDWTREYEGSNILTTSVSYSSYDAYDNPTVVITNGDEAVAGDEKRVETTYINDTINWLIGFASQSVTKAGGLPTSAQTSGKRYYYDTQYKWRVIREDDWLDIDTSSGTQTNLNNYIQVSGVTYNADGTVSTITNYYAGKGVNNLVVTYTYDNTARFRTVTSSKYDTTAITYSTSTTYDFWGNVLTSTDIKGNKVLHAYDALKRETSVKFQPAGASSPYNLKETDYTYAFSAKYIRSTTYSPSTTSCIPGGSALNSYTYYDGLGRITETRTPGFNYNIVVTQTVYQPGQGRILRKSKPCFGNPPMYSGSPISDATWVSYVYDNRGRIATEYGFGKKKMYAYGLKNSPANSVGLNYFANVAIYSSETTREHYKESHRDTYGRLISVESDTMGTSEKLYYGYNDKGALIWVSKSDSGATPLISLTYDSWGRKLTYKDSDSAVTTNYYYDRAGRVIKQEEKTTGGGALTTTFSYTGEMGQLYQKIDTTAGSAIRPQTTYTYFGPGNGENSGEVEKIMDQVYEYDNETRTVTRQFNRSRNSNGELTTQEIYQLPWGSNTLLSLTFSTTTDYQGNLLQKTFPTSTSTSETIAVSYDNSSGLLTKISSPSPYCDTNIYAQYTNYGPMHLLQMSQGTNGQIVTNYSYHSTSELLLSALTSGGGATIQNYSYGYTTDDLVSSVNESVSGYNRTFNYDDKLRLTCFTSYLGQTSLGKKTYTYGTSGQLLRSDDREITPDGAVPHRALSDSLGNIYSYDTFGRMTSKNRYQNSVLTESNIYSYDDWNRIYKVTKNSSNTAFYEYFGDGTRFKKVVYKSGTAYETLTLGDLEIEKLPGSQLRYRIAISGPNGVVAWKQKIVGAAAFAKAANKESYYALAGISFNNFLDNAFSSNLNPKSAFNSNISAILALTKSIGYSVKAISLEENIGNKMAIIVLTFSGFGVILILFGGYPRKELEKLLRKSSLARSSCSSPFAKGGARGICLGQGREPAPLQGLIFFNSALIKHTARLMILTLFFQGAIMFFPMATFGQEEIATPCDETYYPLYDHLGTITKLVKISGGTVTTVFEQNFFPFGQRDESRSSQKIISCNNGEMRDVFPFGFTGHYGDDETGLIYMGARYYDPGIGRFLTPDNVLPSSTDVLSYDRYAYARNNPINLVDPSGNNPLIGAVIGAVIGGIMAAINGQNIFKGIIVGAISGTFFGCASGSFWGTVGAGMVSGVLNAAVYGGDIWRGALIGGATAAIGYGMSQAGGKIFHDLGRFGTGVVSAMSGGVVGGLSSIAMGGSFYGGFRTGFMSAGLSYVAGEIAGAIEGGDSSVSGGAGGRAHSSSTSVDPLGSIPEASTLPENQRNAYVLYGLSTPQEMAEKNLPFPGAAAGEAADFLINKGYHVETIQITSNEQLKTMSNSGGLKNSIVVVAAHYFPFFYWNQGLSTSGRAVAKWLGSSGASMVIYMSCKSSTVAAQTKQIGGMKTWGAEGWLHAQFVRNLGSVNIPIDPRLSLYSIDYWYITH